MLRILFLRSGIDQWPQICRSLRSYLVLAIIKTCKEISFFDYTRTLVQQVDFNPKLSRISFSHLRMHRHVVHCWFIKFYFNPIFQDAEDRLEPNFELPWVSPWEQLSTAPTTQVSFTLKFANILPSPTKYIQSTIFYFVGLYRSSGR